jgi:hypothetical protein
VDVSELIFDHPIDLEPLRAAVKEGFGDPPGLAIITETHGGDFPFLARIVQPAAEQAPTLAQMQAIARSLQAVFLTDDVEVGPLFDDGYSLISPDGTTAVVRADLQGSEDDGLTLSPESRDLYRSVESRLTHAAADVEPFLRAW